MFNLILKGNDELKISNNKIYNILVVINKKQEEMNLLKELMPAPELSPASLEALSSELRQSIFNLLKEEPKNLVDKMKLSWEDWLSR